MGTRITNDLLLVGSLPADSAEQAFRSCGPLLGDAVFAVPDGETGDRQFWVTFEAIHLLTGHPELDQVQAQQDALNLWCVPAFRLRPGVSEITFDRLPRIDAAIESYGLFRSLRKEGVIPAGVRFQLCMPFPASLFGWFFRGRESIQAPDLDPAADFEREYPILERAYEEAWSREMNRLLAAIPAEDLAIQWDICFEVLDLERLFAYTSADTAWERFAGPCRRLSRTIPEEVLVGYHLCYGTFPEWPMREAGDMQLLVDMANACIESSGRSADWVHLAGPRHLRSHDNDFFRPLQQLRAQSTKVYLGLMLPVDGQYGTTARAATASQYLDDFGIAMYCGFGRSPSEDPVETLRTHRAAYDSFVRLRSGTA